VYLGRSQRHILDTRNVLSSRDLHLAVTALGRPHRRTTTHPHDGWRTAPGLHLLSAIVANASGQSTLDFARAKLFNTLGIRTDGAFEPVLSDQIDARQVMHLQQILAGFPLLGPRA
jgi:hypothetical protein